MSVSPSPAPATTPPAAPASRPPPAHQTQQGRVAEQPFRYPLERHFGEPDWTRLPGYRSVTAAEWESALWQRKNTVKNLKELKEALGAFLTDELAEDLARDQAERATMSILIPPT